MAGVAKIVSVNPYAPSDRLSTILIMIISLLDAANTDYTEQISLLIMHQLLNINLNLIPAYLIILLHLLLMLC